MRLGGGRVYVQSAVHMAFVDGCGQHRHRIKALYWSALRVPTLPLQSSLKNVDAYVAMHFYKIVHHCHWIQKPGITL